MFLVVFLAEFFGFYKIVCLGDFRHLVGSVGFRVVGVKLYRQLAVRRFHLFVGAFWFYI